MKNLCETDVKVLHKVAYGEKKKSFSGEKIPIKIGPAIDEIESCGSEEELKIDDAEDNTIGVLEGLELGFGC